MERVKTEAREKFHNPAYDARDNSTFVYEQLGREIENGNIPSLSACNAINENLGDKRRVGELADYIRNDYKNYLNMVRAYNELTNDKFYKTFKELGMYNESLSNLESNMKELARNNYMVLQSRAFSDFSNRLPGPHVARTQPVLYETYKNHYLNEVVMPTFKETVGNPAFEEVSDNINEFMGKFPEYEGPGVAGEDKIKPLFMPVFPDNEKIEETMQSIKTLQAELNNSKGRMARISDVRKGHKQENTRQFTNTLHNRGRIDFGAPEVGYTLSQQMQKENSASLENFKSTLERVGGNNPIRKLEAQAEAEVKKVADAIDAGNRVIENIIAENESIANSRSRSGYERDEARQTVEKEKNELAKRLSGKEQKLNDTRIDERAKRNLDELSKTFNEFVDYADKNISALAGDLNNREIAAEKIKLADKLVGALSNGDMNEVGKIETVRETLDVVLSMPNTQNCAAILKDLNNHLEEKKPINNYDDLQAVHLVVDSINDVARDKTRVNEENSKANYNVVKVDPKTRKKQVIGVANDGMTKALGNTVDKAGFYRALNSALEKKAERASSAPVSAHASRSNSLASIIVKEMSKSTGNLQLSNLPPLQPNQKNDQNQSRTSKTDQQYERTETSSLYSQQKQKLAEQQANQRPTSKLHNVTQRLNTGTSGRVTTQKSKITIVKPVPQKAKQSQK